MLPEFVKSFLRERKNESVDREIHERFIANRNDMLEAYRGLSPSQKMAELKILLEMMCA